MNETLDDVDLAVPVEREELPAAERRTVEAWREILATPAWLFAGAKMGERWPIGRELTEAEYREALERAGNVTCR